jgi:hypothetical protein
MGPYLGDGCIDSGVAREEVWFVGHWLSWLCGWDGLANCEHQVPAVNEGQQELFSACGNDAILADDWLLRKEPLFHNSGVTWHDQIHHKKHDGSCEHQRVEWWIGGYPKSAQNRKDHQGKEKDKGIDSGPRDEELLPALALAPPGTNQKSRPLLI